MTPTPLPQIGDRVRHALLPSYRFVRKSDREFFYAQTRVVEFVLTLKSNTYAYLVNWGDDHSVCNRSSLEKLP